MQPGESPPMSTIWWPLRFAASTNQIIKRWQPICSRNVHRSSSRGQLEGKKARDEACVDGACVDEDLACVSTEAPAVGANSERAAETRVGEDLAGMQRREDSQTMDGFRALLSHGCAEFDGADFLRLLTHLLQLARNDTAFRPLAHKLLSAPIDRTDIRHSCVVAAESVARHDLVLAERAVRTAYVSHSDTPQASDFPGNAFLRALADRSDRPFRTFVAEIRRPSLPSPVRMWGCWRILICLPRVPPSVANCDAVILHDTLFLIATTDLATGTPLMLADNVRFEY
eukprot:Gregarina_sp_Pseudo_9__692@NODE_143_length_3969_cov_23_079898_g131_i0_p2_GENE_NODE_143_length_3969_cov_23_079898_g131_i0NODE_143_length_3969_cov_23_079898_g131_i0_p2_ORF_typecomplete_len285_score66_74_NODE_143_length_3969_cov_23_079898_g131_i030073861